MRKIQRTIGALAMVSIALLYGCGDSKPPTDGNLGTTAPVNNNAPEAQNAPAAPRDPSIIMPGGAGGKKKGGAPQPAGQ